MLEVVSELGRNGKPRFKISKEVKSDLFKRNSRVPVQIGKQNLFLMEYNVNSPDPSPSRKFVISIRQDGRDANQGEHILSQMGLTEYELKILYENIGTVLNYKST